jgi:MoxR-like ATPase
MSVEIVHLEAKDYQPSLHTVYVDSGLHALYDCLAFRSNLFLVGAKGLGKSLSFLAYAAKIQCPVVVVDCSEDIRRSHLVGTYVLQGNNTPFVLGPLPTAFQIANDYGQCMLLLEECNALSPQMQKVLNSALDFRRRVEVPECQKVFSLQADAKLWIVGSMNQTTYGGTYEINEDLKSRVRMLALEYPKPKEEERILRTVLDANQWKVPAVTIKALLTLAQESRQKAVDYALSTRDLLQILEDTVLLGERKALILSLGKFDGEDRITMQARIESIFGIKIKSSADLLAENS